MYYQIDTKLNKEIVKHNKCLWFRVFYEPYKLDKNGVEYFTYHYVCAKYNVTLWKLNNKNQFIYCLKCEFRARLKLEVFY
jgi:hypothetical protein